MHDPQVIHSIVRRPRRRVMHWMIRSEDIVLAAVLFAITLPLMAIVALAIKVDSPGPVLDRHTCIGGGHRFRMLKFRTTEYAPHLVPPPWTQRTTPIGRFLRHARIEPLPQLINVLRGDMSIFNPDGSRPSFLDWRT